MATITSHFQTQVASSPESTALIDGQQRVSYRTLNSRANTVAHQLLSQGRRSGIVVTLLPQGPSLTAASLGCLKAGACYVPLDPTHPAKRLRRLIDQLGADCLIADGCGLTALHEVGYRGTDLNLDTLPLNAGAEDPQVSISPAHRAYILFTSGSTGAPKGVVHTHHSVLNSINVYGDAFQISSHDRQTLLYPPGVLGAARDTFNALLNGAALCYYSIPERGLSGLADWLDETGVTIYCSVATTFRAFARSLTPGRRFLTVRLIKLGGERIAWADVDTVRAHFAPSCQLSCGLAMSEASAVTQLFVDEHTTRSGQFVPLGDPVPGKRVSLIDDDGRPVHDGDTGEIVVHSQHLASGYFGRPDLSARVFIRNPDDDTVAYHTGDLARRDANGQLEYKGRLDAQAKIRGHRVDLSEVEAALRRVERSRDVAAVVEENNTGNRLLAFLAPGFPQPNPSRLRRLLTGVLPQQMIPSEFIFLDQLPRTPSGKPDRRTMLLAWRRGRRPRVAPERTDASDLISTLQGIWAACLHLPDVAADDDFFELGGSSLTALEVLALVERRLHVRIPLSHLVKASTITQLAQLVRTEANNRLWDPIVVLQPEGHLQTLFLIHPVGCNLMHYSDLVRRLRQSGHPIVGLQPRGLDGTATPIFDLPEMASDYCAAVRSVQPRGPYLLGGSSFGGKVAYEMARQLREQGEDIALLALFDTRSSPRTLSYRHLPAWQRSTLRQLNRLQSHYVNLSARTPGDRIAYGKAVIRTAIDRLRRRSAIPESIRRVRRANRRASDAYEPGPYPGTVTLFRARIDPVGLSAPPDLGWSRFAAHVDTRFVDGYHGECCRDPHATSLAEELGRALATAAFVSGPSPLARPETPPRATLGMVTALERRQQF